MTPRRILYPLAGALALYLAFTAGRAAGGKLTVSTGDARFVLSCPEDSAILGVGSFEGGYWSDYECRPIEDLARADSLEVRLVPDDQGDGLLVRAWMWDGDGHVVWTRDLAPGEPLAALWDESEEGQYAVDAHHGMAESEVP